MTTPTCCALCEDPLSGGHDLIGGLALCRRCFHGELRGVAKARGWTLWSEHAEFGEQMDGSDRQYVTQVRLVIAAEPALRLVGQRYHWWMMLVGLVRGRARSNDPLFEAHVRIWTPAPGQVELFMRRPGVESSLFDVLGNLPTSRVEIRGSSLSLRYAADDPHTEGEIVARAAVLALHLERFAADDNPAPRSQAPVRPG